MAKPSVTSHKVSSGMNVSAGPKSLVDEEVKNNRDGREAFSLVGLSVIFLSCFCF